MLRVEGQDAADFLNAQCTAMFDEQADATVQIAALADPKGRVLSIFHAWCEDDAWHLSVPAGEAEWLCSYLARFVFRSQVRIAPASERHLLGVAGSEAAAALAAVGLPAPKQDEFVHAGSLVVVRLAGNRWLAIGEETALADVAHTLASHVSSSDASAWRRARLLAGEPEIRTETRGRFLPQMLGLVELGTVSFRKGCYPGQEVIARAQYLGRVKRARALFRLDANPEAGSTIELEGSRLEVLDSAAIPEGGALVQAVAPSPLPPELSPHTYAARVSESSNDS
ncbi:MAG: YgfZ/GcvT domain-containing protein [Gammaproteobacteria bacterium]